MKKVIILLSGLLGLAPAYGQQAADSDVITNVSVTAFRSLIDSLEDEIVIDLRTPEELTQGKIQGAMVIDFFGSDFEPAIQRLERSKVYLLYCAGGGRSAETAELMRSMGFRRIYNLEPGFNSWVKNKMPVTKQ